MDVLISLFDHSCALIGSLGVGSSGLALLNDLLVG